MAIKDIMGSGIGFAPPGPKFIMTRGLNAGPIVDGPYCFETELDAHVPGAVADDVFVPGSEADEVCT